MDFSIELLYHINISVLLIYQQVIIITSLTILGQWNNFSNKNTSYYYNKIFTISVTCQTTNATVQVNINNTLQGDNQNKPQSTLNTIQSTHLQCYDCSPMHNPEGCEDPENAVIPPRVSLCKNQDKEPNVTLTCISTFIHVPGILLEYIYLFYFQLTL